MTYEEEDQEKRKKPSGCCGFSMENSEIFLAAKRQVNNGEGSFDK